MVISLDLFFIEELQENGYAITFNELKEIYSQSRIKHQEALKEGRKAYNRKKALEYYYNVGREKRQEKKRKERENK